MVRLIKKLEDYHRYQSGGNYWCGIVTSLGELLTLGMPAEFDLIRNKYKLKADEEFVNVVYAWSIGVDDESSGNLYVCGSCIPEWFNDEIISRVEKEMRENKLIRTELTSGVIACLLHGEYVLSGNVVVKELKEAVIIKMEGNSRIIHVGFNGYIKEMKGNSRIDNLEANSTVGIMRGHSRIINARNRSHVSLLRDDAVIENVWDQFTLPTIWPGGRMVNDRRTAKVSYYEPRSEHDWRRKFSNNPDTYSCQKSG